MVKTDVEGHDLVILRFQVFYQKKSCKYTLVLYFCHSYSCTGTWSLGFDPEFFGWNGGGTSYWRWTSTKVIFPSKLFKSQREIDSHFKSLFINSKVLIQVIVFIFSFLGDECTEGSKELFSVGKGLGYMIYR